MADDRRIVIELKVSSGSGDSKSSTEKEWDKEVNDLVSKIKKVQHPLAAAEDAILKKAGANRSEFVDYAVNRAKSLTKNYVFYSLNKYYNLTEDYQSEQDLSNALSIINHIGEFSGEVAAGAVAGAKTTGGFGAVAGAIAGGVFGAADIVINALKAHDAQSIKLNTIRIQSGYQRTRMGLIDDGRGTQN